MEKSNKVSLSTVVVAVAFTLSLAGPIVALAAGPAGVNLGTAGNFVILAKTGISTTGSTSIVGDIGLSPAAASYITGFALTTPPTTFTTSTKVTGKVFAANYTEPTPAYLSTAVNDMQTAYTDAAGRPDPGFMELFAGNLGGQILGPGLYKWSTGVTIPKDVTLSGRANDVWIFQVAGTLNVSSGKKILLSGDAQASNIFWVVAGQTTIGTTAVFNGNILDQTAIVLKTSAVLHGRALAQTAVTLDSNSVTIPDAVVMIPTLTPPAPPPFPPPLPPAPPLILPPLPPQISAPASTTQPSITVISPKGGETYQFGVEIPFSWKRNVIKDMIAPTLYLDNATGGLVDVLGNFLPDAYGNILSNSNTLAVQTGAIPANIAIPITGGKFKVEVCEYPKNTNNRAYPATSPFCASSKDYFTIAPLDVNSEPALAASLTAKPATLIPAPPAIPKPTPTLLPDLTTGPVSSSATAPLIAIFLSATVTNTNASTGTGFTTLFQRATSDTGANATDIGTVGSNAYSAGESTGDSLSYNFPKSGTYYFRACADKNSATDAGVITESDEDNNCGTWTVVVVSDVLPGGANESAKPVISKPREVIDSNTEIEFSFSAPKEAIESKVFLSCDTGLSAYFSDNTTPRTPTPYPDICNTLQENPLQENTMYDNHQRTSDRDMKFRNDTTQEKVATLKMTVTMPDASVLESDISSITINPLATSSEPSDVKNPGLWDVLTPFTGLFGTFQSPREERPQDSPALAPTPSFNQPFQAIYSSILASLDNARKKGRDAKRIADIGSIRVALELYYDTNQSYPLTLTSLVTPGFLPWIPADPSATGACTTGTEASCYSYAALGSDTSCSSYHLGADLEVADNPALSSDADATPDDMLCTLGLFDAIPPEGFSLANFSGADTGKCKASDIGVACYDVKPASAQAPTTDTSNWKTYENQEFGFSIKYPPNYSTRENPLELNDPSWDNMGLLDIFGTTKNEFGGSSVVAVYLQKQPIVSGGVVYHTARDYMQRFYLGARKDPTAELVSINGVEAVRHQLSQGYAEDDRYPTYYFVRDDLIYQVVLNENDPNHDAIIQSVKFQADGPWAGPFPVVTTQAASSVTATSATLRGTINTNGANTTYWFEYSTDSDVAVSLAKTTPKSLAKEGQKTLSYEANVSNLQSGTTYYYRIVTGSEPGNTVSFKTN